MRFFKGLYVKILTITLPNADCCRLPDSCEHVEKRNERFYVSDKLYTSRTDVWPLWVGNAILILGLHSLLASLFTVRPMYTTHQCRLKLNTNL